MRKAPTYRPKVIASEAKQSPVPPLKKLANSKGYFGVLPMILGLLSFFLLGQTFAHNSYLAEQAHCKKILKRLWEKQGGQAMPGIFIESIAEYGKPAEYDVQRKSIIIDPRAYKLCLEVSNQKDDALAFLIAHELVHAYQHNSFSYTSPGFFVKSKSLKSWAESQKRRRRQMESKADIWGAVLCYLAGYSIENSILEFIEELYEAFDLSEEDPLYDSKKERLAIASRAKEEVKKALQLYDMALYMSLLQQHDKDTVLYQYLIDDFKSAEFYNNLGLSYAKLALPMLDEPYRSYPYPFVLDTESRLDKISKGRLGANKLMLKSISSLNEAIRLNPDYLANRLNRACVFHMLSLGAGRNKNYYIDQAKMDINYVQRYNIRSYPGPAPEIEVLYQKSGDLLKLIRQPAYASRVKPIPQIEVPECSFMEVDGLDISSPYSLNRVNPDWKLHVSFEKGIEVFGKKRQHSEVLLYKDNTQSQSFVLQLVKKPLPKPPTNVFQVGVKIPQSARKHLRKSISVLQAHNYLIHDQYGIIYKLSPEGVVQEWALFREI